ncbi:hypothetical protein LCGC14_0623030 [marine sediment metagenome]|uniref:Uncharacterized protein n=1 Tax=marine sediment metagenome TaxID=412755 RepID=A0A0F9TQN7_9ZZZZ
MSNLKQFIVFVGGEDLTLLTSAGVDPAEFVSSTVRGELAALQEQERKKRVRTTTKARDEAAEQLLKEPSSEEAETEEEPPDG